MARPPKAIELHKLDGTYRKDRHENRGVLVEKLESIEPPEVLNEYACKAWKSVIPGLCASGLISNVDITELTDAFVHFGIAQECIDYVNKNFDSYAQYLLTVNPRSDTSLINEYNKHMKCYNDIMHKFGITPVERAKIKTPASDKETDSDIALKNIIGNG